MKEYYPTQTTQDIYDFTACSSCRNDSETQRYRIAGYSSDSDSIQFIDYSNTYQVTTSQVFTLQYSEGCCGVGTLEQGIIQVNLVQIYL